MKQIIKSISRVRSKRKGRARKGEGSLRLRGTTYWYRIPNPVRGRKPLEGSCRTGDLQQAILEKNKALAESRQTTGPKKVEPATIAELAAEYLEEKTTEGRHREETDPDFDSQRGLAVIRCRLKHICEHLGDLLADDLTSDHISRYRTHRETVDGTAFTAVNQDLRYLRAVLRRAMGLTPPKASRVPKLWMPSEKSRVREGFVERDGYQKILAHLPDSLKAIHICGFHVGARSNELKKIRWEMINWNLGIIVISPKTAKGGRGRSIPIWGDMAAALKWQQSIRNAYYPNCPWVFFWHPGEGGRFSGCKLGSFDTQYKKAVTTAGFSNIVFHDLRRSAIKYAIQEAGIDNTVVRHMSGHKTDNMLMRYNIGGEKEMGNLGRALDESLKKHKYPVSNIVPMPARKRA